MDDLAFGDLALDGSSLNCSAKDGFFAAGDWVCVSGDSPASDIGLSLSAP
jgi:hypothetical protein